MNLLKVAILILVVRLMNAALPAEANAGYYISLVNKTGHELDAVAVYYGDKKISSKAVIVKGGNATAGAFTVQLPLEAEVRWEETGHNLNEIGAFYDDQQVGFKKELRERAKVGHSEPIELPIPDEAEVRWEQDGIHHSVKAKLSGLVPKDFSEGMIDFIIKENSSVEVRTSKWRDTARGRKSNK
jgi:hypothetical protein